MEQKTQRRKRREKQRKLSGVSLAAIVFGVILLVGVAGGLFALQLLDTTAETIVAQEIRDFIEDTEGAVREITHEQLGMLLDGIDFWRAHQKLSYRSVL